MRLIFICVCLVFIVFHLIIISARLDVISKSLNNNESVKTSQADYLVDSNGVRLEIIK